MALPFDDDPVHKAEIRARALRKRKAQALLASGHEPYARLGEKMMEAVEAEVVESRLARNRAFDEALKQAGLEREAARDAFAREKEAHDIEAEQRRFERETAEHLANQKFREQQLGLQRRGLAQQEQLRREAMAQAREQFYAQQGQEPPAEPGSEMLPSHPVAPSPGAQVPTVAGEPLPSTRLDRKAPVFQQKAVMESAAAIVRLNRAFKLLQRTPSAYGGFNALAGTGAALAGGIPILGQAAGPLATSGVQRLMTKEERETRNEVDSLVDEAIKAISGGQVTAYEDLRKTYLPRPYDSSDQAQEKIKGMLQRAIGTYKSFGGVDDVPLPEAAGEVDIDALVRKYLPAKGGR